MHELTLLYGVVQKVEQVCKENDLDRVDAIVIEVGEATSVIPEFLQDAHKSDRPLSCMRHGIPDSCQ